MIFNYRGWINLAQDLSRFHQWGRRQTTWKNRLDFIPRSIWILKYIIIFNSRGQVIIAMTWLCGCGHELKSYSWIGLTNDPVQLLIQCKNILSGFHGRWSSPPSLKGFNDRKYEQLTLAGNTAHSVLGPFPSLESHSVWNRNLPYTDFHPLDIGPMSIMQSKSRPLSWYVPNWLNKHSQVQSPHE